MRNRKFIKSILLTFIVVLPALARGETTASLLKLDDDEVHAVIEKGGEEFVVRYGNELLDLLYYRPSPTQEELLESTANPPVLKFRKEDLPVYRALRSQKSATLKLLQETDHFKLPEHRSNLEVVAYLMYDLLGEDESRKMCVKNIQSGLFFEVENWKEILELLDEPDLKTGRFISDAVSGKVEPSAVSMRECRRSISLAIQALSESERDEMIAMIFRFGKILHAIHHYSDDCDIFPSTIYSLVVSKLLEPEELVFIDKDGFQVIPKLKSKGSDEAKVARFLILDLPGRQFRFVGLSDSTIRVTRTVSEKR